MGENYRRLLNTAVGGLVPGVKTFGLVSPLEEAGAGARLLTSATGVGEAGRVTTTRGPWSRFRADRFAMVGLVMVAVLTVLALSAGLVAVIVGHGPNQLFPTELNSFGLPAGPTSKFLFGADEQGRDLLVRVFYGLGTSLTVSLLATIIAITVARRRHVRRSAGRLGRHGDRPAGRCVFGGSCGAGGDQRLLGVRDQRRGAPRRGDPSRESVWWWQFWRWPVGRTSPASFAGRPCSSISRSLCWRRGLWGRRACGSCSRKSCQPGLRQVLVVAALLIPNNVLFEATLSFLGVGIPPTTPSLGRMLAERPPGPLHVRLVDDGVPRRAAPAAHPWIHVVADGLRDALAGG